MGRALVMDGLITGASSREKDALTTAWSLILHDVRRQWAQAEVARIPEAQPVEKGNGRSASLSEILHEVGRQWAEAESYRPRNGKPRR